MERSPIIPLVPSRVRQIARRCSRAKKPPAQRTQGRTADGFLNHKFLPIWGTRFSRKHQTEADFLSSVKHLCTLYQFPEPDVTAYHFPHSVAKAYEELNRRFDKFHSLDVEIVSPGKNTACLATRETFNTGQTLYYVPVKPVWLMAERPGHQPFSEMMLDIFRYLYQVIGLPFYTEPCYLDYIYGIMENWVNDLIDEEDDVEFRKLQIAELKLLSDAGEKVLTQIKTPFDPGRLSRSIENFRASGIKFPNAEELACSFLQLAQAYPGVSYSSRLPEYEPGEEEELVMMDCYLSFYWSGEDCFEESLIETVSSDLQERGWMEEPVHLQLFNEPQEKTGSDFLFEKKLLDLLSSLSELLNTYDYECKTQISDDGDS